MDQNERKVKLNYIFSIIAFLELVFSGVFTLLISPDPKNAWVLGFSKQRWVLTIIIVILALLFLISGIIAKNQKTTLINFIHNKTSGFWYQGIKISEFILMLWGLFSILFPPSLFANWAIIYSEQILPLMNAFGLNVLANFAIYYERIRPISITIGLVIFQFEILSFVLDNPDRLRSIAWAKPIFRTSLFFIILLLFLAGFVGITKIGLVKDTAYWNVVGIPITGLQFLALIIAISFEIFFFHSIDQALPSRGISRLKKFLPFLIYFGTILVWGLTPLLKHSFSLQPTFPNFQPYPWSDARWLDLGGLSIIKGYGINFHNFSDKPLYMVFLAILHLFAGNNYSLMSWLQILVLSFTPVILFLLGKKFYNQSFGLFLAVIIILRQKNAIDLSYKIASVNPKLLVSEMMTLLGVALLTYVVFLWLRNPKPWLALTAGGVLGATSLIRMNAMLIFPLIGFIALVSMWKFPRIKWRLSALYMLGFFILVTPWLISGVDQNGTPFALGKINFIIQIRYQTIPQATQRPPGLPLKFESYNFNQEKTTYKKITSINQNNSTSPLNPANSVQSLSTQSLISNEIVNLYNFLDLFTNHFIHNIVTSTLALPDATVYNNLDNIRLRPYWIEGSGWQGDLPPTQIVSIILNIMIIAIGLGFSWSKFRWAGLVPLIIFLGYDLSLAFAMTSGSRYIVPIDWIIYFYFGLTLVCMIRWLSTIIRGQNQIVSAEMESLESQGFQNKKRLWQSIVILIVIASLIPLANNLVPMLINQTNLSDNILKSIPEAQKVDTDILIGELLYPYYGIDSSFKFDLLSNGNVTSYTIILDPQPLEVTLLGGEIILIGNNSGNIDYIYLISGSSIKLIWDRNSS